MSEPNYIRQSPETEAVKEATAHQINDIWEQLDLTDHSQRIIGKQLCDLIATLGGLTYGIRAESAVEVPVDPKPSGFRGHPQVVAIVEKDGIQVHFNYLKDSWLNKDKFTDGRWLVEYTPIDDTQELPGIAKFTITRNTGEEEAQYGTLGTDFGPQ
jgi:hypothetical protein